MKMLYGFCTVMAVGLIVFIGQKFFGSVESKSDQLPKKFGHYQSLDSLKTIRSGKISMELLLESTEDIQYFLTPENEVIAYGVAGQMRNIFIKISPGGTVLDSLVINAKPLSLAFVKGYIVNKDENQYYRWSFDGNRHPFSISLQNEHFEWDTQKQQALFDSIVKKSPTVVIDYGTASPEPVKSSAGELQTIPAMQTFTTMTYFVKNKCFKFFTTLNVSRQFPYAYTEELLLNSFFKKINNNISGNREIIKTPDIRYRYFQKLKPEKVRFSGGGGNTPGFTKLIFHGNLFTDVIYKNDTLKLKEFMYLDEGWHASQIEIDGKNIGTLTKNKVQPPHYIDAYLYYTNPQLAYALFSNDDKKLYLIK